MGIFSALSQKSLKAAEAIKYHPRRVPHPLLSSLTPYLLKSFLKVGSEYMTPLYAIQKNL